MTPDTVAILTPVQPRGSSGLLAVAGREPAGIRGRRLHSGNCTDGTIAHHGQHLSLIGLGMHVMHRQSQDGRRLAAWGLFDRNANNAPERFLDRLLAGDDARLLTELCGEHALIWEGNDGAINFYSSPEATRPLFFTRLTEGLAIASQIRDALSIGAIPARKNLPAWARHLQFGHQGQNGHETLFQDVERAISGHLYRYDLHTGKVSHAPLWAEPSDDISISEMEAGEHLMDLCRSSVDLRLAARGRHCLALSGGFDSGLVLALSSTTNGGESLDCYGLGFPGWEMDETAAIAEGSKTLGANYKIVDGSIHPPSGYARRLCAALDHLPSTATDAYIDILAPHMTEHGPALRWSGFAGDAILSSGPSYIRALDAQGHQMRAAFRALRYRERPGLDLRTRLRNLRAYLSHRRAELAVKPWMSNWGREVALASHSRQQDFLSRHDPLKADRALTLQLLRSGAWSDLVQQRAANWQMDTVNPLVCRRIAAFSMSLPPGLLDLYQFPRELIRRHARPIMPECFNRRRYKVLHNRYAADPGFHALIREDPADWSLTLAGLIEPNQLRSCLQQIQPRNSMPLWLGPLIRAECLSRRIS